MRMLLTKFARNPPLVAPLASRSMRLYLIFILTAALPTAWLTSVLLVVRRDNRRRRTGLCLACGYSLTGNFSGVCPECGTPVPQKSERYPPSGAAISA